MSRTQETAANIFQRFRNARLGTRLAIGLLPLFLIPVLLVGGMSYFRARDLLKQQTTTTMISATEEQIANIENWASERQDWLFLRASQGSLKMALADVLRNPDDEVLKQITRQELTNLLSIKSPSLFTELMVIRISNSRPTEIIVSTQPLRENTSPPCLAQIPINRLNTLPLANNQVFAPKSLAFLTSTPIRALDNSAPDTLLVGVNSGTSVVTLMEQTQVFWQRKGVYRIESGRAFLALSPDTLIRLPPSTMSLLVQPDPQHPIFKTEIVSEPAVSEYLSFDDEPVLGSYQWLPEWNMALVIELPMAIAFAGLGTLLSRTLLLLLATAILVGLLVPWAVNRSLRPLDTLMRTVERMTKGDLKQRVPITRHDEIGRLAESFNHMANELAVFYQSLEDRVRTRTRQIHTAAQVGQDASAIRDIDQLLDEAVRVISDRFGFYHAAVFLLDDSEEFALLKSASSEGGQRLLQGEYKLPVGKTSIVGYVAATGESRKANDIEEDAVFITNPELPLTRSEIALPLRRGKKVIGALDVQSIKENAFSQEDLLVLQTMADQLAIAIENADLIEQQTYLANVRQKMLDIYQHLTQMQSLEQLIATIPPTIQSSLGFIRVTLAMTQGNELVIQSSTPEQPSDRPPIFVSGPIGQGILGQAVQANAPIFLTPEAVGEHLATGVGTKELPSVLSLPLISGGRILGVLGIERYSHFSPIGEESQALEMLAGQIATSIENAMLLEGTQRSLSQVQTLYRQQTRGAWADLLSTQPDSMINAVYERDPTAESERESEQSRLSTPLKLREEILGHVELIDTKNKTWSDDDRVIIESIADEVAGVIEQQRLLNETHRRAAQLQVAAEIARDSTGLLDVTTIIQRAVHLIRDRFGYYHVAVFLLDNAGQLSVIRGTAAEDYSDLQTKATQLPIGSQPIISQVIKRGESYVAHDVLIDPLYQYSPVFPDARSAVGIPLKVGGRVIGVLDVLDVHVHAFRDDDIAVLETLADQLAVAIQNAHAYEEAIHGAERKETVINITSKLRKSQDIDMLLRKAAGEFRTALGAKRSRIHLAKSGAKPPGVHYPSADEMGTPERPGLNQEDTARQSNKGHPDKGKTA